MAGSWIEPRTGARPSQAVALARLAKGSVVLLGERHDQLGDHLWQAKVIAGLADLRSDVAVGFEMFPRRVQPALDAWVAGGLDERGFLAEARWSEVWGFADLYWPVLRLCRDLRLAMRALNIDRPLVSLIGREGWDALPAGERSWLSPARAATPDYRRYLFEVTGGLRPGRAATGPDDPAFDRFVRAQQAWDRAFACAIASAISEAPGRLVAALIGRGHLEFGYGTPAQLADLGVDGVTVALRGGALDAGPPIADLVFVPSDDRD